MAWAAGIRRSAALALAWLAGAAPAAAGEADVLAVQVLCEEELCVFSVTVRHDDEGWEHYADRWEILGPNGEVLATRVLAHPHVGEQPFTRRLPGVRVPDGVRAVLVRASDSVHGHGGREQRVEIPEPEAPPPPRDG